jgi:hypothetical protein
MGTSVGGGLTGAALLLSTLVVVFDPDSTRMPIVGGTNGIPVCFVFDNQVWWAPTSMVLAGA